MYVTPIATSTRPRRAASAASKRSLRTTED
jgi:hypothetical protein